MAIKFWMEPAGVAAVCRCAAGFLLAGSIFFYDGMRVLQNIATLSPLILLLMLFFCKNNGSRAVLIIFTAIMMVVISGFSWQLPVLTVALWVFLTAIGAGYYGWVCRNKSRYLEFIAAILLTILGIGLLIKAFNAPLENEELLFGMIFCSTSIFTAGRILAIWHQKFSQNKSD